MVLPVQPPNLFVVGDNGAVLPELRARGYGPFRTIYMDPPYNSGRRFDAYDDRRTRTDWVRFMRERLSTMHDLLARDGVLVAQIDDTELGTLQMLLDDVFGAEHRLSTITVVRSAATGHKAQNRGVVNVADYVLLYAKDRTRARLHKLYVPRSEMDWAYNLFVEGLEDGPEAWQLRPLRAHVAEHLGHGSVRSATSALGATGFRDAVRSYALANASRVARLAQPRVEAISKEARALVAQSRACPHRILTLERGARAPLHLYRGNRILFLAAKVRDADGTLTLVEPLTNVWTDIGYQGLAREGGVRYDRSKKPERLLERILALCTDQGDWVLDPFAGTATTAVVAHRLGRRWVAIEQSPEAASLARQRLEREGIPLPQATNGEGKGHDGRGPHRWLTWAAAALACAALAGCKREPPPTAQPPLLASENAPAPTPEARLDDDTLGSFAEKMAEGRYGTALRRIEALPADAKSSLEARVAYAKASVLTGRCEEALPVLDEIAERVPLLGDWVRAQRAAAGLTCGDARGAGEYFSSVGSPTALFHAAHAFERAQLPQRVKGVLDRIVAHDKRTRRDEVRARAHRMKLMGSADDARWLVVHAPGDGAAGEAASLLAKIDPTHPLTAEELLKRAVALAESRDADRALEAIDQAATLLATRGKRMPPAERARLRADALFAAKTRLPDAARLYAEAAAMGGPNAPKDLLRSGRSLARAHRDDEAIATYRALVLRYPKSREASEAAFQIPLLELLHGRWREASAGFDRYLKTFGSSPEALEARRGSALGKLMAKRYRDARVEFERLADEVGRDRTLRGRMLCLAALAALRDGDRTHALARWREVERDMPWTWPALVAAQRLRELGAAEDPEAAPPLGLGAAEDGPAEGRSGASADGPAAAVESSGVILPSPVDLLARAGLFDDADGALRGREGWIAARDPTRALERQCDAYGGLDRGARRMELGALAPAALLQSAPGPTNTWAWNCSFPKPYRVFVERSAEREKVPPALVWAVMRQESAFRTDATSPVGAVGLLQLMVETAREEAADPKLDDASLYEPDRNIALGTKHLGRLLTQFKRSLPFAVAAYNAGSEAVLRWANHAPQTDADVFVERIPFTETRNYTVRVLGNYARYAHLAAGAGASGTPRPAVGLRSPLGNGTAREP